MSIYIILTLILIIIVIVIYVYKTIESNKIFNTEIGDKSRSITIKVIAGLCNRLRTTFSWHKFAKSQNKHLYVVWTYHDACPGFFLDFFEPVEGITFLRADVNIKNIDYKGDQKHEAFHNVFLYDELKLKPHIQLKIKKIMNKLSTQKSGDYIAIHVRRTDHTKLAELHNNFTSDKDFFKFLENNSGSNVYLATDNPITQEIFNNKYGDKIIVNNKIKNKHTHRLTSVEDAIIDLFICLHAKLFKGSGFSSFTDFILEQRGNNKIIK
ncbi:MAG: hypothetical protein Terrestrivirus1_26 [Terrestrivirus sp.]|uniref:Uncharacterized protein n=1 Tax=Terrestrivirus sp. TaxID=2487775 RepID=A0A3G4ZJZ1_9VIRU|nr:MAG: hypothetical protein Terrestrivirus1_26 [Terrestrivirus sp.]